MIVATLAFLAGSASPKMWVFDSAQSNFAAVVDNIVTNEPTDEDVSLQGAIPPSAKGELHIKTDDFTKLMFMVSAQSSLRFTKWRGDKRKWFVVWADGAPGKGQVRIYEQGGSYYLDAAEVTVKDIEDAFSKDLNVDAKTVFTAMGIDHTKAIKSLKVEPLKSHINELKEQFVLRVGSECVKTITTAPPDTPKRTKAVWNLTFLPGSPPDPDSTANRLDFTKFGGSSTAALMADAITKAYAPFQTMGPDGKPVDGVANLRVTSVNNSLVIDGLDSDVRQIKRLLATQLDVPQSQILLELDAYQVSANRKSQDQAERSLRRLVLGQEIARAYKHAHMLAIRETLAELKERITAEMARRQKISPADSLDGESRRELDVKKLFQLVGLATDSRSLLGETEILAMLAYCPNDPLVDAFTKKLSEKFQETKQGICEKLLVPMKQVLKSDDDKKLFDDLSKLNDNISAATPILQPMAFQPGQTSQDVYRMRSAMLRSFAKDRAEGDIEDVATRTEIEDFLLLWISNVQPSDVLDKQSATKDLLGTLIKEYVILPPRPPKTPPTPKPGESPEKPPEWFTRLLNGDVSSKLVRAGQKLDELLDIGIQAIASDSAALVDRPLSAWIDKGLAPGNSAFGMRFGGSATLAVTSRMPGIMGTETETFFPFQPTAPISLNSLIPLLSTTPQKPADATSSAGLLAAGGLTPLESTILQGVFSQADKQPYYRKLGTGIHFSVLPTMLPNGSSARLQIKLALSVTPDDTNKGGAGSADQPGPIDLIKTSVIETEILANELDITRVSSLKLDVSAPGKRDWAVPILSQILPIRSWFVGPTQDKTVRHEAVVVVRVTIIPRAMDLASRYLGQDLSGTPAPKAGGGSN